MLNATAQQTSELCVEQKKSSLTTRNSFVTERAWK